MSALESLRERLAELADLSSLGRLAAWDQRTMMPPAGAASRAQQLGAMQRLMHERPTSDDIGAWLEEIEADGHLGDVDRDVVRVARRDWDRERRIPADLAAARVKAAAEGQAVWQDARAARTSPSSRRRSSATWCSRASMRRASTTAAIPTTRCSPTTTTG